jgi:hypothetical protein
VLTAAAAQVALARLTTTEQPTVQWCDRVFFPGRGGVWFELGCGKRCWGYAAAVYVEGISLVEHHPYCFHV